MLVVAELKELFRQPGVPRLVQPAVLPQPPGDRPEHSVGHAREAPQGLVPVLPGAEVYLGHRPEADLLQDVYHNARLDRVPGEERDRAEQLRIRNELPGQWLHKAG